METRGVKFNLKEFCKDYVYALNTDDTDEIQEIESDFESFMKRADSDLKVKIISYLSNNEDVKSNKKLAIFVSKFSK